MSDPAPIFAADGPLAAAIPGFRARPQQIEMAQRIAEALRENRVLVAEAGTGTGKTFAYLVPALLAGGKVIISTGTKTLQDQLFNRDLPTVRAALKVPVRIALLKGRANYVCHYHLERNARDGRFLTAQDAADLRAIARFAQVTQTGDKAECTDVREDSLAWIAATSTRDNCLGQDCPNKEECFVMQARRNAMEADVVVVNHHLFFADVMLRDEGMGELLPACNAVIFDEAHQLPETASLFFGDSVSTAQVLELARDTRSETVAAARDCVAMIDQTRNLEKAARDLRLVFGAESARMSAAQAAERENFDAMVEAPGEGARRLPRRARHPGRALRGPRQLPAPHRGDGRAPGELAQARGQGPDPLGRGLHPVARAQRHAAACVGRVQAPARGPPAGVDLHLGDAGGGQGRLRPLLPRAWAGRGWTRRRSPRCGAAPSTTPSRPCCMRPPACPSPNSPDYTERVAKVALPLIRAARGRAFVLCTSLRAMRRIHELILDGLAAERRRPAGAAAGRGLAHRAARALPSPGQRGAGGEPELLGRAWTCRATRCRWW